MNKKAYALDDAKNFGDSPQLTGREREVWNRFIVPKMLKMDAQSLTAAQEAVENASEANPGLAKMLGQLFLGYKAWMTAQRGLVHA